MRLGDAERVNVTTFDAAGEGTTSTNFVVHMAEDKVGLWTTESGPWTQRLALSDVVSLHAATSSGKVLREEPVLEGRARLVTEGGMPNLDQPSMRATFAAGKTGIHITST